MRTALFLLGLALLLVGMLLWMAGGLQSPRRFEGDVVKLSEPGPVSTSTLTVVVWNIAWGYGRGSEGSGDSKPPSHFEATLARMADVLTQSRADIALLQEVDFDSQRSGGIDQARRLAELAGFPFIAPAVSWRANYVPFPYWPPSNHFGRVISGGAILSRLPIETNDITLLPKPDDNLVVYNWFYLFRYHQRVRVRWSGAPIVVYNAHLEAFDGTNRQAQARAWVEVLNRESGDLTLVGGDFNAIPPESMTRSNFADMPKISYETDRTVPLIRGAKGLRDTVPSEAFLERPSAYFTYPAHDPNRKLDHLMVTGDFRVISARVMQEAGGVSDHLPLLVRLGPRKTN
ncbi:MAG: endonuclease/exonuclease/phosphatase family protein [Myxococcota bacterium]